ncbi:hypothetical protein SR39_02190 [Methylobacterium radiotolerans]|jgi:transcriptional regulator with XRE-family HTH domain|uniref:helix-turn-helix domain-containing protein n=1 Tax=unclassified Methylobacterium TaxID=2615210 RepID=UPI0005B990C7|nr:MULTISPECIES: helix-turn-helix transcriptional regulator [unclassified Methylobacterium]KIU37094.1 hypothetical protein SR39_02190 [Methylobacterium radiotolerans]RUP22595.1 MAG: XRE family transcriptional regulator [Methylobacterium sp.]
MKEQDEEKPMSGAEFRERLRELGRSHAEFAREVGSSPRSVDRWISGRPPPEIAYIVDLLMTIQLVAPQPLQADRPISERSFQSELDRIFSRAEAEGRKAEFIAAIEGWLRANAA